MKKNTVWIVASFLAVVVIGFIFWTNRGRGTSTEVRIGNNSVKIGTEGSKPGIVADGLTSKNGGLEATDKTGRGVEAKNSTTQDSIKLTNEAPPK